MLLHLCYNKSSEIAWLRRGLRSPAFSDNNFSKPPLCPAGLSDPLIGGFFMFRGIIADTGTVVSAQEGAEIRLTIESCHLYQTRRPGDMVAVNGVGLFVTSGQSPLCGVALPQDVLQTSNFTALRQDAVLNLELPAKLGDPIPGQILAGKSDIARKVLKVSSEHGMHKITVSANAVVSKYIVRHGYIAVNGMSFPVDAVDPASSSFTVTASDDQFHSSNLKDLAASDLVNLEYDLLIKYAEKVVVPPVIQAEHAPKTAAPTSSQYRVSDSESVSEDFLRARGFI